MYADFRVKDNWSGEEMHCMYQALIANGALPKGRATQDR